MKTDISQQSLRAYIYYICVLQIAAVNLGGEGDHTTAVVPGKCI